MSFRAPFPAALFALCPLAVLLCGCHSHPFSGSAEQARADRQAELDSQRQQMELIPPPSKSRFETVHNVESWQNPSITVEPGMLELRVTLADSDPQAFGTGGMLRPVAARQQELNIGLDKLAEAVTSIPQSSWPYGRVISVEEPEKTPAKAEPQIRRNLEVTVRRLNDLGIVAYDVHDAIVR